MSKTRALFAYPSSPGQIGKTIEAAVGNFKSPEIEVKTWKDAGVPGESIAQGVLARIDNTDVLLADITHLNFNVTFEIGYALGRGIPVIPTINTSLSPQTKEIGRLGMFDSLLSQSYNNTPELTEILRKIRESSPAQFHRPDVDLKAPVYLLALSRPTDMAVRIVARIKKSRVMFRSFDPAEQPRLSAQEAHRGVASSVAVIILLVADYITDHFENNIRGAFIAGLALGMNKTTLILQDGDNPVPLDYRDLVKICRRPNDVDRYIADLAPTVIEGIQNLENRQPTIPTSFLSKVDLGAAAAENEMSNLSHYYLPTAQFEKVLKTNIRLVVGRKGSGKTAMFVQIRDKIRSDKKRVVLDLRPEGYQLKKFKDMLLSFSEATQEHLSTAFWEYTLLLEVCHKILEKDRQIHVYDRALAEPYDRLYDLYHSDEFVREGDFSERMLQLVLRLSCSASEATAHQLTTREVVEIIYRHDIGALREELVHYLRHKKDVWILFDNIDKGWPTKGVQPSDILVLRGLLDATRDIERLFQRKNITTRTIVFLRNDVYELLVDEMPDRGKESRISLDWTNADLLKEVLRRRIASNEGVIKESSFEDIWTSIAVSHIDGERTDDLLVELSLMRPRYLLTLVGHCLANAVNLSHAKIETADIQQAAAEHSADVANDINLEIRDVFPSANDILYSFIGCPHKISVHDAKEKLREAGVPATDWNRLLEVLLWFAFFGVITEEGDPMYSYSVFYDMKKLRTLARSFAVPTIELAIHPAFHPFLNVRRG